MTEPDENTERTDEIIAEKYPDRGERPSDDVVVDSNVKPAPNTEHPR